jgi:sporulation protein YlmC with PRC-barrel domain
MEKEQETTNLISSEMVAGTTVYNTGGEEIGSIHDIMLDKKSGNVAYAVMSFGGFLGMGEKYHPLPWSLSRVEAAPLAADLSLAEFEAPGRRASALLFCPEFADRIALLSRGG